MCGVVGIVSSSPVNQALYQSLILLQHRGQDAAGIVTTDGHKMYLRKSNGLVRDVFLQRHMDHLAGNIGIAHVRYPTAGTASSAEAQPMYVNSPFGIALGHNGNIIDSGRLAREIRERQHRHLNTDSDSEVLLNVLAAELSAAHSGGALKPEEVFQAVENLHRRCLGGYAMVALILGLGVLGIRDPRGIRPLVLGKRETAVGDDWMLASESTALTNLGFQLVKDLEPGEAVLIGSDGQIRSRLPTEKYAHTPCIFEYVYLARPDSLMDGVSVYRARLEMGERLAHQVRMHITAPDERIDAVIPIPESGSTSARALSQALGVPCRDAIVRNRYIGRTFIMPEQGERQTSVRRKFSIIGDELHGRNVLLVDDSLVRGTTSSQIIQLVRNAGAKRVYMALAAPPIRYPNLYGIDMPAQHEFVAHGKTEAEIARVVGADKVIYQQLDDLIDSVRSAGGRMAEFDCSVFNGEYVTGGVDAETFGRLARARSNTAKRKARVVQDTDLVEIHNHA
ncbi:MAG: amidophosphoribosyltransferase [Gammaproteobacteria bacterium]|nr:amidophosphoribosyltransferase [Gammaproteobacteria bacterium]MCY4198915.1 amidophosphoribosyltransferase [Gammaproteobacteria bacterium]MCY4277405.1 amidophosphoribosyltransferase [Gammaproteobacteria bacterium]MCY4323635.1 amidophosphoribosyltransferase [Gammaproteobacteria bacterium]